jgi:hypothetical protein
VRTLDDIWNLYAAADKTGRDLATGDVVWEEEDGVMDLLSDLTAAINQEIAPDEPSYMWELWVNDVNLQLNQCTASDWDSDTTWIIGFTIGADNEPTVDARDNWVPSTMKLVEIDPADADTLGGKGAPMADEGDYSAATAYARKRLEARSKFLERAADTKSMKLTDEQVSKYAEVFGIEGEGAELRTAVEAHVQSEFGASENPPEPTPPTPAPPTPTEPPEPTAVKLASFSEEQRAELAPLLETLNERAERGDRAYAQHFGEVRDGKIQTAIDSGRLNPADREQWVAFYNANPDLASKQLEALPVNPALIITFGLDEDGLTTEQADSRDKAVEEAYLVATGVHEPPAPGGNS